MLNLSDKKIIVTGGSGFLGRFVVQKLIAHGAVEKNILIPRSAKYDLRKEQDVRKMYKDFPCDIVIHLAARVGGIGYNKENPASLYIDNLLIGTHTLGYARHFGIKKFVGVGTICEYPKFTPVPFKEEDLWSGYPEETNAPYGLAKKMLLIQSQSYRQQYGFNAIHLMPVNLYGVGDNFDPKSSHVIPALIKKVDEAIMNGKGEVAVWGTGKASREFLYVEDAAEGIVKAAVLYDRPEPVNIGSGMEIKIKELIKLICQIMQFKGKIVFDKTKPDGQPRRCLDVSKAKKEFDFEAKTDFNTGLKKTIRWYQENKGKLKFG